MGVRYNAQKRKVGMYYTTPVYQFRMKCHLCDNHFEIKTDPANLDYEIVSGARRQEKRFKAEDNGTVVPDDKEEIQKLASDEMFKLEHGDADKGKGVASRPVIKKIYEIQDRSAEPFIQLLVLQSEIGCACQGPCRNPTPPPKSLLVTCLGRPSNVVPVLLLLLYHVF